MKDFLLVIVGPTAVGKTDVAIELANRLNGEIISADSMQIYKYMNIGTAKPTVEERKGIIHHLMDFIDPNQDYSVAEYQKDAIKAINDIKLRHKCPIVVGGSGLYVNSIIYPMNFTKATENTAYRKSLNNLVKEKGNIYLYNCLKIIDPDTAYRLHPNDSRRVIRALEVYYTTGKPMFEYKQNFNSIDDKFNSIVIGLTMDREMLYERINKRVDLMLDNGLIEEVRSLMELGYSRQLKSMQGIGYKEFFPYFDGEISLEESVEILKRETRRFAKRQLTWFKRDKRIYWINPTNYQSMNDLLEHILNYISQKSL